MARALTAQGIPTPRGTATWTHTTVSCLMRRMKSMPT
ncbi:hypothetical protein [Neoroseomonas lacus]